MKYRYNQDRYMKLKDKKMKILEHKKTELEGNNNCVETDDVRFFDYEAGIFEIPSLEQEELITKYEFVENVGNGNSDLQFYREKIAKLISESGEKNVIINSYVESGIRIYMNCFKNKKQIVYNNLFRQTIEINFQNGIALDVGSRKNSIENFEGFVKRVNQYINYKRNRKSDAQSGIYKVIFDPELTGLLVHEFVGHVFERDVWLENPILQEFFSKGKIVTSEDITIVDNPCLKNGYGSYDYDDEGNKAKKTILIQNGCVFDYMKSKKYDYEGTGSCNGRFVNIGDEVLVRMSNTYMLPGKKKVSELFKEIDYGLYMVGNTDCNFSGVTQISPREIYKIENGRVCEALESVTVYIDPVVFLNNILGISEECAFYGGGLGGCGKKNQWPLPIGSGGPFVAVDKLLCEFSKVKENGIK